MRFLDMLWMYDTMIAMHNDVRKGSRALVTVVVLSITVIVGGLIYYHGGFAENARAEQTAGN